MRLKYPYPARPVRALLDVYRRAGADVLREGLDWYHEAHTYARELADTYGYTLDQCARVIAALSPSVTWSLNQRDARELIAWHAQGKRGLKPVPATYQKNVRKAEAILDGNLDALRGPKVTAFAALIVAPERSDVVCIDSHAWNAMARESDGTTDTVVTVTRKRYAFAVEAYQRAAEIVGIRGAQLQAIVWLQWRVEQRKDYERRAKSAGGY